MFFPRGLGQCQDVDKAHAPWCTHVKHGQFSVCLEPTFEPNFSYKSFPCMLKNGMLIFGVCQLSYDI